MEVINTSGSFDIFPPEIIGHITSFLDIKSICKFHSICKYLYSCFEISKRDYHVNVIKKADDKSISEERVISPYGISFYKQSINPRFIEKLKVFGWYIDDFAENWETYDKYIKVNIYEHRLYLFQGNYKGEKYLMFVRWKTNPNQPSITISFDTVENVSREDYFYKGTDEPKYYYDFYQDVYSDLEGCMTRRDIDQCKYLIRWLLGYADYYRFFILASKHGIYEVMDYLVNEYKSFAYTDISIDTMLEYGSNVVGYNGDLVTLQKLIDLGLKNYKLLLQGANSGNKIDKIKNYLIKNRHIS